MGVDAEYEVGRKMGSVISERHVFEIKSEAFIALCDRHAKNACREKLLVALRNYTLRQRPRCYIKKQSFKA